VLLVDVATTALYSVYFARCNTAVCTPTVCGSG